MKLNNLQILNIYTVLNNRCEQLSDIKLRWKLAGLSEEIFGIKQRFEAEKNNIIQEYGKEDEKTKQMSLDVNDKHFKELLNCETEVHPILLSELNDIPLSIDELLILKPIIKDDE